MDLLFQETALPDIGVSQKIDLKDSSASQGTSCLIEANNDLQAAQSWLEKFQHSPNTFKAYRKEAERFLLWCACEVGKPMAELTVEDFRRYFDFLQNPPKVWCANIPRASKSSGHWKPFVGPLSHSAYLFSIRAIHSLLNFLVEANYLASNPLKLMGKSFGSNLDMDVQKYQVWERMLETDEWTAIQTVLEELPEKTKSEKDNKLRAQMLFFMLYFLGLRINELVEHGWNAFRRKNEQWWFFVKGKGGKLGHIPVNHQLMDAVRAYRKFLGKSEYPDIQETSSIFVSRKTKQGLSTRTLYEIIKKIGNQAAEQFPEKPEKQEKLKRLSPHWLRHLSASHQDKAGVPATMIQANHRHSSMQTTQIYVHAEDDRRFEEIQKLSMSLNLAKVKALDSGDVQLSLKISGGSLTEEFSLVRLLDRIESVALGGISFQKLSADIPADYQQFRKFGKPFNVSYRVKNISKSRLAVVKETIAREGKIRLFTINLEESILES